MAVITGAPGTPSVESAPAGSLEELRDRISAAFRAQFPSRQADGSYRYHYLVATFADSVIVSVDQPTGEEYYRYDYAIDGEAVTFSNPQRVELKYVPVEATAEAARQRAQRVQAPRQQFRETHAVAEANAGTDGGTLTLTVIRAGFNVARSRYYTEAAVREGASVFRGLKMYANHQTRAEEQARPEGDVWQWVASITETAYDEASKSLRATAKLIDPTFRAKVAALAEAGLLSQLGVSIRAVGAGEQSTIESVPTFRVDEFTHGISVDFVTEPGAGGGVLMLEAAEEPGIHALTLPQLRERRPDLVVALMSESKQHKEAGVEITQEMLDAEKRRAEEAERLAREASEKAAAAESALQEMRAEQAKATAQEAIGKLIAESGLPEPSQKHLRESLQDETDTERAKTTIESHKAYVAALTGRGAVRGNGASPEGTSPSGAVRPLAESLSRLGMTPEQAAIAEKGR